VRVLWMGFGRDPACTMVCCPSSRSRKRGFKDREEMDDKAKEMRTAFGRSGEVETFSTTKLCKHMQPIAITHSLITSNP